MPRAEFLLTTLRLLWVASACGGCAQIEFDATPGNGGQTVRIGDSQDVTFSGDAISRGPLQYRMRADEGHLILWIDNPTNDPVELLGDKSNVVDPEGISHPLNGGTIAPGRSAKEIFPPVVEPPNSGPAGPAGAVNNYDRPGFITLPDTNAAMEGNDPNWQWDDTLDIRLNLFFQQDGHPFEQHFSVSRVRK